MPLTPNTPVKLSVGDSRNKGKVINHVWPWSKLLQMLEKPHRTPETQRDFKSFALERKINLKGAAGYWMRSQNEDGHRKRGNSLPGTLITLDFDYATQSYFEKVRNGELAVGYGYAIHTSRSHTEENPRFRMILVCSEEYTEDDYERISRIVAFQMDPKMEFVDKVSFRSAQMMFKPTASKDQDYVFAEIKGELVDWRAELDIYETAYGDPYNIQNLPRCVGELNLRETAEKAENPTEKTGPVGTFCRAYDVETAIAQFELPYEPVSEITGKPRYTYTGGSTRNGAEVQDGGLFLYSHHGTDPVADMLVNAFDLVRIHKFGRLDEEKDLTDVPMKDHPSWKSMMELCKGDPDYKAQQLEEKYDVEAMFNDLPEAEHYEATQSREDQAIADLVGDPDEVETPPKDDSFEAVVDGAIHLNAFGEPVLKGQRRRKPPVQKGWTTELDTTDEGKVKNSSFNMALLLQSDARFRDSIAYNQFTQAVTLLRPVGSKHPAIPTMEPENRLTGDPWEDHMDATLHVILSAPNGPGKPGWGITPVDKNVQNGVLMCARSNQFHPIREVLNSFKPDPLARAEMLFVDYLGCPDTPYYREAARIWMIGAVARIFEPGCKFDSVPVLYGPQGCGKSTFIKRLALGFFGELTASFSEEQKLVEQMRGNWIMEIAELVSMVRAEVEHAKSFLSATHNQVRMAYAKHEQRFMRQCVFMGSTNKSDFLKDETGGRRYLPIEVLTAKIDVARLIRNLPGLWADALRMYLEMREAQPEGELPLFLDGEAHKEALHLQDVATRDGDTHYLAEEILPIINSTYASHEAFSDADLGETPEPGELMQAVSPKWIKAKLEDQKTSPHAVAAALLALGWQKGGSKKRILGSAGPVSVYEPIPGKAVGRTPDCLRLETDDLDDDAASLV